MDLSKGMKIKVKDEEESELIQKELFRLGYTWATGDTKIRYAGEPYLVLSEGGSLGFNYRHQLTKFHGYSEPEVNFIKKVTYSFEEVEETVELNGKEYLKSDLEEALNKLTPIEE